MKFEVVDLYKVYRSKIVRRNFVVYWLTGFIDFETEWFVIEPSVFCWRMILEFERFFKVTIHDVLTQFTSDVHQRCVDAEICNAVSVYRF